MVEVTTACRSWRAAVTPRIARLLDSVPPEVNTTWDGAHPSSAATWSRDRSTASWATRPGPWPLEGLPK